MKARQSQRGFLQRSCPGTRSKTTNVMRRIPIFVVGEVSARGGKGGERRKYSTVSSDNCQNNSFGSLHHPVIKRVPLKTGKLVIPHTS